MKTLVLVLLVFIAPALRAQDCSSYYYLQDNKTVEMSLYDKKGDLAGKVVYSIADVKSANGTTTANVQSQMFDKKGRTFAKGNSVVKCNGGVMMVNLKMVMPTPQAEQFSQASARTDDFFIEYPVNMNKGDSSWYNNPWVWIVGAAVFILLLVAIVRGGRTSD